MKNLELFLEKAAENPVLAEKLKALERSYLEQITALAKEEGVGLTAEDFCTEAVLLSDDSIENVSGGWSPNAFGHYCTLHGCE